MGRGLPAMLLFLGAAGPVWSAEAALQLTDDRGERIGAPVEVCFQLDLRQECVNAGSGEAITPPARFQSLHAEGPDHGPVTVRSEELAATEGGGFLVRIPRKARLQVENPPAGPLTVTVYDPRARSFDKPLLNAPNAGTEGVKVPAGDLLVSLSSGRQAPDLHLLTTEPGALARVKYQPRKGWSLVVRCRARKTEQPLGSAVVFVESVQGYGRPNRSVGERTTGVNGIALFPGLLGRTVDAKVRHPELLPLKVQGLSAAPGALSFRDVVLEEGGLVRAWITVNGQAQEGVICNVIDFRAPVAPQGETWKPEKLYEGRTDRKGICRTDRLPAGSYTFTVALPEDRGGMERSIVVENGSEADEEFIFSEIRVTGRISRGDKAVEGFTVMALQENEELGVPFKAAQAVSGEDGTYGITLWRPGLYHFFLSRSSKILPISRKDISISGEEGTETVDFSLESASIRGKVVDEEGHPLEEAVLKLRWAGVGESFARTGPQGEFEFLLESGGSGEIVALKKGYRESSPVEVALAGDEDPPPVVVVLNREKLFRGILLSAAGSSVAGALVGTMQNRFGDEPIQVITRRTDAEGRFEVAPIEGARNRLYASGPGCPLSFFEPLDTGGDLALRCQGQPAVLDLTLRDVEGHPVPNAEVILRQGAVIIPRNLLSDHLAQLGLRSQTDGSGRLVIPNLAPGDYDIFVANPVSEGMIEAGSRTGYLASARLTPLTTSELTLTVGAPARSTQ